MKRLFFILTLIIWSVASFAQDNTLKFLGIPVDGTEANMIAQLKQKGFKYDALNKCLIGKFNGRNSTVFISTNHGKVDRIYVADADNMNEADIRVRFNQLLKQMKNNSKYFFVEGKVIPESEDISYEMSVNNKRYEASFSLTPTLSEAEEAVIQDAVDALRTKLESEGMSQRQIMDALTDEAERLMSYKVTGSVWFMISEYYGKYYISMYYDNLTNRPHGEDL